MSTSLIQNLIRKKHSNIKGELGGFLIFELNTAVGHAVGEPSRIDAFFMCETVSKGLRRTAYEIKVSRADFLRELKNPLKRRAALRVSNQFYFITMPGIAKPEEIPIECGLIEASGEGTYLETIVDAPYRDGLPANWLFFVAVARRLQKGNELNGGVKP